MQPGKQRAVSERRLCGLRGTSDAAGGGKDTVQIRRACAQGQAKVGARSGDVEQTSVGMCTGRPDRQSGAFRAAGGM